MDDIFILQKKFNKSIKSNQSNDIKSIINLGLDPSYGENWAIIYVCNKGYIDILEILLGDERINPSINNNQCLFLGIINGFTHIVDRLIKDKRVNCSIDNNFALTTAIHHDKNDIVKLLISDSRVIDELRKSTSELTPIIRKKTLQILGDIDKDEESEWSYMQISQDSSYQTYSYGDYLYSFAKFVKII